MQQLAGRFEGARDHDLRGVVAAERVERHAHVDAGFLGGQGPVDVLRGEDPVQGSYPPRSATSRSRSM